MTINGSEVEPPQQRPMWRRGGSSRAAGGRPRAQRWWSLYARSTFISKDTFAGATALFLSGAFFMVDPVARQTGGQLLLPATVGVCAGLLGVILAAMAIVTAFVNRIFVVMLGGDLEEALTPFFTTAVVAAAGLLVSLLSLVTLPSVEWWADALLLACSGAMTVWTVVGVVQLVGIVKFFATVRAQELRTLAEAEALRAARIEAEASRR